LGRVGRRECPQPKQLAKAGGERLRLTDFVVVDASVWVARLVPQDAFHSASRAWIDQHLSQQGFLLSPALLLVEVAGAVSRRTGDSDLAQRASDSLKKLPGLRLVEMGRTLVQESARLAADLGLRGADAFYVALAAQLKLPLITLDDDQRNRSIAVIQTLIL